MNAYTNIKIEMENNEVAKVAIEKAAAAIKTNDLFKSDGNNIERFITDIRVEEGNIITVNESSSLDSNEYEVLVPLMMKAIAAIEEVKTFKANTYHYSCNCGYEAYCNADYENGMLRTEACAAEDFYGCCDECGGFEIHFTEYDPSKTYICGECGKVLTEKDLFPYGVPEVTFECYNI